MTASPRTARRLKVGVGQILSQVNKVFTETAGSGLQVFLNGHVIKHPNCCRYSLGKDNCTKLRRHCQGLDTGTGS